MVVGDLRKVAAIDGVLREGTLPIHENGKVMNPMTEQTMSQPQLDVARIRGEFPILHQLVHGKPLVYLDNAATTQKPQSVIDALTAYLEHDNANIHRGVHLLSERATVQYEGAREKVRAFLNAPDVRGIVFVRGTTEAINLVANTYGRANVGEGDDIIISAMEHHSNIVPWQMLATEKKANLKIIPMNERGELEIDAYEALLGPRTKIVSVGHVSNALGTINPVKRMTALAHAHSAIMVVDGAQAAPHLKVDVQDIGCDFYAISGHKMYGPTGVGVLAARTELLEAMPPYQGGGDMIRSVSFEKTTYNDIPYKFEAGTPNISGGIGLGAAIDYLNTIGLDGIAAHEEDLLQYATKSLTAIPGVRIIGTAAEKAGAISFDIEGIHPHDIGTLVDREGVAIRTGHHCAQPVMKFFKVPATSRASFAVYNTRDDVDRLVAALHKVIEVFR